MYPAAWCAVTGGATGASLLAAFKFFATTQCMLTESWPGHAQPKNGTCFDFIVVGGGTAGATLAARLAEEPDFKVLLVEAGGDPPLDAIIPGFRSTLIGSRFDWNFTTTDDGVSSQALVKGEQAQPRGKMLGGSGSINDMVYARGFPADYDEWAALGLGEDWNWEHVLPYFKKTERLTDPNIIKDPELRSLHGLSGEIEVAGLNKSNTDTAKFLEAFNELGFKSVKDMTNPYTIGAGRHSHTIRNGHRHSSVTALLNKAAGKNNLFIMKHTFVSKILVSNKNKANGVVANFEDDEFHFYATKEVIVSAGTFNTPKLLMLSGIGPKNHLDELKIPVVTELPVGDNLHDHIMVLNYISAENGTCYSREADIHMNTIRYLYDHSGPFSYVDTMATYMPVEGADPNLPEFAFYPSCMPVGTPFYDVCVRLLRLKENICAKLNEILKTRELFTIAAVLMKPNSRGRVRLHSKDHMQNPLIYSGTFSNKGDLDLYPQAIQKVKDLAETSYFKSKKAEFVDLDIEGCKDMVGDEEVKCKVRAVAMSAWHSVGTAAMGTVLDERLRVKGVTGLRVVDASVMPKVIRGNTNAPVIMIAEKAADYIKADHKSCR